MFFKRTIKTELLKTLKAGKSILLLGPRQTGKTTLLSSIQSDLTLNLARPKLRQEFEKDPERLIQMVGAVIDSHSDKRQLGTPLVIIDEIQKAASLMDVIQILIDDGKAQFMLTGSSARKLRKQAETNLLPGRLLQFRMDPLSIQECGDLSLEHYLFQGSLPRIAALTDSNEIEQELSSYVEIYLEEEVRAEAIVRNLPGFYRFLELAALESGKIVSANALSQDLGIAQTTVQAYFEVLEDCLIVERVEPITRNATRKKLMKSPKYLFYDMGVRRAAAHEGLRVGPDRKGDLFEHWIGLELIRAFRRIRPKVQVHYWRDPDGPEVDWVLEKEGKFLPIEVKWKSKVTSKDTKHLKTFMNEYPCPWGGVVVCQTEHALRLDSKLTAMPWKEFLLGVTEKLES